MRFTFRYVGSLLAWNSFAVGLALITFNGCADSSAFIDKTKKEASILYGEDVKPADSYSKNVVMIAQNFKLENSKPVFFGLCTGIVLNPRTILTAAHCALNFKTSRVLETNSVHSGDLKSSQVFKITKSIIHSDYRRNQSKEADIALLKLDRPLSSAVGLDKSYMAQTLWSLDQVDTASSSNLSAIILGYGRLTSNTVVHENQILNGVLQKATVTIFPYQFKSKIFSIDQINKPGVCSGDSGGPLYIQVKDTPYLVGLSIAVFKTPEQEHNEDLIHNACNYNGLFLNLEFHKQWMRESLNTL